MKWFLLPLLLITTLNLKAQEITENTFGEGLINIVAKDSSYSLLFAARFQSLFTSQWIFPEDATAESGDSNFMIRRSRLKFDGFAYSPKLEYKLELGLSNRDISGGNEYTSEAPRIILDAILKWNFHENFVLWVGQAKLPGNRERVVSSGDLQIVDRSLLNSRFNIDRDVGFQLHHKVHLGNKFVVKEIFAVSQGEGRNVTSGNLGGYQYTGRLEVLPFGEFNDYVEADLKRHQDPKLSAGVSFDHNHDAVRTRSNSGSYMVTDEGFFATNVNTLFIDAMFKYRGFSFMGEYAKRTSENPVAVHSDGTPTGDMVNVGSGLNLQAGYLLKHNYEVVGRYTNIAMAAARENPRDVENQYTLGLSKYFVGHKLKVQTDVSFNDLNHDLTDRMMYRLQCELHF